VRPQRPPEDETTASEPAATAHTRTGTDGADGAAAVWRPARALLREVLRQVGTEAAEAGRLAELAELAGAGAAQITDDRGTRVSAAFLAARSAPSLPEVRHAYRRLRVESDALYARLVAPREDGGLGLRVHHQLTDPYQQADEIVDDLAGGILRIGPNRQPHPLMGTQPGGPYDRFRAVHDVLGHAALGAGFDRHGEYACWLVQRRLHTPAAAAALTPELHGENCVLWVTGRHAVHKAALLPAALRDPPAASPAR